jgi:TolB-like protein
MMIRPLEMKKSYVPDTAEKYMVVFPFRNDSPDRENDYVNSGVTSEIYAHLQKIPGIRLKSRTFTEQGWNREKDLQTFGRKLGVDYILEGSTRKVGDSIRITVQLSEVNSGNQVWADSYDGIYNDKVLAFQSEVAMEVASSLDLVLSGEEINKIRHQSTRDILAWDLVSRGQYMIRMLKYSLESKYIDQALDFFNRAVEADPQYARVYYSKGWAYLMMFQHDSAMYYADKAIELDPDDYLGYKLKGTLYMMQGDLPHYPELAITYLTKALDMEPEDYFTIQALGTTYCLYTNDVKKGLTLLSKALITCNESMTSNKSIDLWMHNSADLGGIYKNISQTLMFMGEYDLAAKYFKKTLAMGNGMHGVREYWTTLILLGKPEEAINLIDSLDNVKELEMQCYFEQFRIYMLLGKYGEAEKSINKGFSYGEDLSFVSFPDLALMYEKLERKEEALSILNKCELMLDNKFSKGKSSDYYLLHAKIYCILNQKEKALKYLSEAVKIGIWADDADLLTINPVFENLREDPEFKALVKSAQDKIAIKKAKVRELEEKGELAL